jgi:signal transduction histidine kinase
MKNERPDDYVFWPEAMLPAWIVADNDLVVRNRNNFAFQLLSAVGKGDLFFNDLLSLRLKDFPSEQHESLWKCILDPNYANNTEYISEALKILQCHIVILNKFVGDEFSQPIESLVAKLATVTANPTLQDAVVPYIIRPRMEVAKPEFVMGIKISPPQGLKLIQRVELENSVVEYIDIVMAYRLCSHWANDKKLQRVDFLGAQPAIHDATFRHGLWEKVKLEEQAEITQFLSHAFKTPISNIQSMTRELQQTELTKHYREVCEKLEAQVGDLSNLSDLILFINSSEPVPTTLCGSQPKDAIVWEYIQVDEIKEEIAKTIRSIHKGRTRNTSDRKKIELLARSNGDSPREGVLNYSELAETIVDVQDLEQRTTFGLLFPKVPRLEANAEKAAEIAKKCRTTFLNLLLAELFLNAVKYSDAEMPEVRVHFSLNSSLDRLDINIINNGAELTASEFINARTELANKPGEKRRALGLLLNLRAAEILGWRLEWKKPARPGTNLVLCIPFVV